MQRYIDEENKELFWDVLKNAVENILRNKYSDLNFEYLNKIAGKLVTSRHSEYVYTGLELILKEYLQKNVNKTFISEKLSIGLHL